MSSDAHERLVAWHERRLLRDRWVHHLQVTKAAVAQHIGHLQRLEAEVGQQSRELQALRGGLAGVFAAMVGQKQERLTEKRAEAYAAVAARDQQQAVISEAQREVARIEQTIAGMGDVDTGFHAAAQAKHDVVVQRDDEAGAEVREMAELVARRRVWSKEIVDALQTGNAAAGHIRVCLVELQREIANSRHGSHGLGVGWNARRAAGAMQRAHLALDRFGREVGEVEHEMRIGLVAPMLHDSAHRLIRTMVKGVASAHVLQGAVAHLRQIQYGVQQLIAALNHHFRENEQTRAGAQRVYDAALLDA